MKPAAVLVGVVVCLPVQVLACAVFSEATTAPVVGLTVSVESLFATDDTDPHPDEHEPHTGSVPFETRQAPFVPTFSAVAAEEC